MKITGSKQRACMGGWLLAALLLAGVNAHQYMSMADQPLMGYSQTIKLLQANLHLLDNSLADGLFSTASQIELPEPATQLTIAEKAKKDHRATDADNGPKNQTPKTAVLPSLTGIMHVVDPDGGAYFQAVLNGRVCRAKDKIDNFTVVKISRAGVVIGRSGLKWTIESPTPYFSSDQGN